MLRFGPIALMTAALAAPLPFAAPAAAQSGDPAAQALIDRLRPTTAGPSRGIRVPGETPPPAPPTAPAPVWGAAAAAPSGAIVPVVPVQPAPASPRASTASATARPPTPAAATMRDTTAEAPAVSITVNFATGSAQLTPEAERALAPLGRALSSADLRPYRFRIEGHTDTVGSRESNQQLSEARALAVRNYIVQRFGVQPDRLEAIGLGEDQPLVATGDEVPERRNRRVQILNLGS